MLVGDGLLAAKQVRHSRSWTSMFMLPLVGIACTAQFAFAKDCGRDDASSASAPNEETPKAGSVVRTSQSDEDATLKISSSDMVPILPDATALGDRTVDTTGAATSDGEGTAAGRGGWTPLIASYEPSEANLTVTSPDAGMTVVWPLLGGAGGVPPATDGEYVLKMEWGGETDRKVEIKHQWSDFSFDLAGYVEIQADVYFVASSALPEIVGIWDDVFGWTSGFPVPVTTNEWVTVAMDVRHLEHTGLDHIWAFLFENLAGIEGTVYVDNLRLVGTRAISFSGYEWTVKSGDNLGPGPNYFSQCEDNVWVDDEGHLHMKVAQRHGRWYCSEIIATDSPGYGTYAFTVQSRLDVVDENIVLGLFTWDSNAPQFNYREIDFEIGRWTDPANDNAQFVVQPWDTPGNLYRFDIDYSGSTDTITYVMSWQTDGIRFSSYYGKFSLVPSHGNIIASWLYTGGDNPPAGGEHIRMNLWLVSGIAPVNGKDADVVIADFKYLPVISDHPSDFDNDGDTDLDDFSGFVGCMAGPDETPSPPLANTVQECLEIFDFDADADVDTDDFAEFQGVFTG